MTLFEYLMNKIFGILDTAIQEANLIMCTTSKITRIRVKII